MKNATQILSCHTSLAGLDRFLRKTRGEKAIGLEVLARWNDQTRPTNSKVHLSNLAVVANK